MRISFIIICDHVLYIFFMFYNAFHKGTIVKNDDMFFTKLLSLQFYTD